MPIAYAGLWVALALTASPDAVRLDLATLPDGTAVATPAQWISLRAEAPEMLRRWRDALDHGEKLQLADMFVAPALMAQWRQAGRAFPQAGTNMLFVARCPATLTDGAIPGKAGLDAMARAMREEALARRQRDAGAGQPPYDVAFGPSVQGDSVVAVIRKENAESESQPYLLSNSAFWAGGRCMTLLLNGKESDIGDVARLIELSGRLVDATRKAAEAR